MSEELKEEELNIESTPPKEPEENKEVQINLSNVFPYMVKALEQNNLALHRLQKTVDAIGLLLAEHAIKKD